MITITINGKRIKAKKGDTVLKIAERAGIRIPTLCYHKDLTPFGGCRLCIVEVKGRKTPLTACTLYAEDGMEIKTNTPRLRKLRRFTLQLILSEHPNACLICEREKDCANFQECIKKSAVTFGCKSCPQNDNCELQDMVRELGVKDIPFDFRYRGLEVERHDPFFDRDYNLCILCGRCIRVCQEIRNANTLQFQHRGPETLVGTAFDLPHLEADCQFCGACVDFCPTGALRDRFSRYDKPPDKAVKTTCMLCSIGCQIDLNVSGEKITCSTPHRSQLCVRGRFGIAPILNHPKRITAPLMKKGDTLVEVEWVEALDFVTRKLHEHRKRTGILLTSQLTNETADKIYSFADILGMKIAAQMDSTHPPVPLKIDKIKGSVAFIIVNTDMVSDYSVLLLKLRKKFKKNAAFIIIDAVAGKTSRYADAVLSPVPGTENDVLHALIGSRKIKKQTGIQTTEIEAAKSLTAGRKIFVLYEPPNSPTLKVPKPARALLLHSQCNMLKFTELGFDATQEQILADKSIDCLYVIGAAPNLTRKYQTVIVQDCFLPDFDFDVFLPAATFAEMNGSVYGIEGNMKKVRRVALPAGKAMSDDKIIDTLASATNVRLKKRIQKRRPKKTKKIVSQKITKEYPITLITRQNAYGYRNKTLSTILKGFDRLRGDRHIWLNEKTAAKYKLKENAEVRLTGRRGTLTAPVKISPFIPDGTVLIYYNQSNKNTAFGPVRLECIKS